MNKQSAYSIGRTIETGNVDEDITAAMRRYLEEDLGLNTTFARARAENELIRKIPAFVLRTLSDERIDIFQKDVLDLGAGLGGMSEELVLRGARVTSLEPGKAWASLTQRRVSRHGGHFKLIHSVGESIPIPSSSIDVVISLQVLEHVQSPEKVLGEVWRVLRPGGFFYLACENYLAFREGHYQVPWIPLMPKPMGSIYLRALGRSPQFLNESVTYTTQPGVLHTCDRLGFFRRRDQAIISGLKTKTGPKWDALRILAKLTHGRGPVWLDRWRNTFKFGISEIFEKPRESV